MPETVNESRNFWVKFTGVIIIFLTVIFQLSGFIWKQQEKYFDTRFNILEKRLDKIEVSFNVQYSKFSAV